MFEIVRRYSHARRLALTAAFAVLSLSAAAPAAHATFRGHGSRIAWAYAAYDPNYHFSPDYGIRSVGANGRAGRTLALCNSNAAGGGGPAVCPQWAHVSYSPNGRRLVWAVTPLGGGSHLVLAKANGSGRVAIAHPGESDSEPSFSPNGKRLVYVRALSGTSSEQIVTSDLSGGNVHVLVTLTSVDTAVGVDPAWSPNGREILYTNGHSLWVVGVGGHGARQLISGAERGDWSPSGRQIVYIAHSSGLIHLAPSNGMGRRLLHFSLPGGFGLPHSAEYAVFSPDGTRIAFAGVDQSADPTIYVVSVRGGHARTVDNYYTGDEGAPTGFGTVGLSWQP